MLPKQVNLLSHQYKAIRSGHKFTLLRGGIGSGKSFTGSHFAYANCAENPRALGFIGANTYSQLLHSTLNCFFAVLEELQVKFNYNRNRGIVTLQNDARILCKSMENYEMHRGIEIGWFWLDESRDMKREAFEVMIGRLRDKNMKKYRGLLTSSPKGFDWQYDYFEGEGVTNNCTLVTAKSYDNIYLPEGYIDTLIEQYDDKMKEQEVEGKIIDITSGGIYYGFKRDVHLQECNPLDRKIYIAMDFNVDPMTAVAGYIEGDRVFIFDEVYLRDSNTFQMSDELIKRYGKCEIIPDSTSNKRSTSSHKSDLQILRESGHTIIFNPNPYVEDRYNCVNGLFSKNRITIDPRCKMLIKDLERFSRNNKDRLLSHASDSLGYFCWRFFPIKRIVQKTKTFEL